MNERYGCVSWRQISHGNADGERKPKNDKKCHELIPNGASGYCECANGEKKMKKLNGEVPQYETCNDACNGK